jgi:hypothetical protein
VHEQTSLEDETSMRPRKIDRLIAATIVLVAMAAVPARAANGWTADAVTEVPGSRVRVAEPNSSVPDPTTTSNSASLQSNTMGGLDSQGSIKATFTRKYRAVGTGGQYVGELTCTASASAGGSIGGDQVVAAEGAGNSASAGGAPNPNVLIAPVAHATAWRRYTNPGAITIGEGSPSPDTGRFLLEGAAPLTVDLPATLFARSALKVKGPNLPSGTAFGNATVTFSNPPPLM